MNCAVYQVCSHMDEYQHEGRHDPLEFTALTHEIRPPVKTGDESNCRAARPRCRSSHLELDIRKMSRATTLILTHGGDYRGRMVA